MNLAELKEAYKARKLALDSAKKEEDKYKAQHQRNRQMDQRQQSGLKWMNPTCQMRCRP